MNGVSKMVARRNDEFQKDLGKMPREELEDIAYNAIQTTSKMIHRMIYICKFMEMPDDVIQELIMMGHDDEMFKVAMSEFDKTNPGIFIVDLSAGEDRKIDKIGNSTKNNTWGGPWR